MRLPTGGELVRQMESGLELVKEVLREGDAEYWFEKGISSLNAQLWEESVSHFARGSSLDCNNGKMWLFRAYSLGKLQRLDEAASCMLLSYDSSGLSHWDNADSRVEGFKKFLIGILWKNRNTPALNVAFALFGRRWLEFNDFDQLMHTTSHWFFPRQISHAVSTPFVNEKYACYSLSLLFDEAYLIHKGDHNWFYYRIASESFLDGRVNLMPHKPRHRLDRAIARITMEDHLGALQDVQCYRELIKNQSKTVFYPTSFCIGQEEEDLGSNPITAACWKIFDCEWLEAYKSFSNLASEYSNQPAVYYGLGVAKQNLGYQEAAQADFAKAAELERQAKQQAS